MARFWLRRMGLLLTLCFLTSVMAGCAPFINTLITRLTPSPTQTAVIPTLVSPTKVQEGLGGPTPTPTSPMDDPIDCAYVQATHRDANLSTQLNLAFQKAGLTEVEGEVSIVGEDCIDTTTKQIVRFNATQTDFYITIATSSTTDPQGMGDWIGRLNSVLEEFQPGKVPGLNPGYISITFTSGADMVNLWVPRRKVKNLLDEGIKGGALFDALRASQ